MTMTKSETECRTVGPELRTKLPAELLGVKQVAQLLGGCSARHIYRLADADRMPRPIRLGNLVRWRRAELMEWIEGGCQPIRAKRSTAP